MSRRQPAIWAALTVIRKIVNVLPHRSAVSLGKFLGGLVCFFSVKKREEAVRRCSEVLGITNDEAFEIVKGSYGHFGGAVAEFARMPAMAPRMDEIITMHGDSLEKAYKEGKGVILITAHIGNWEYAASYCASHGYPINALGTDQRDDRLTELIKDLRRAGGTKALGKASDLRAMLKALAAGEIIAVPIDQDARKKGVLSPFLGKPASTPTGVAKLAYRTGCAVIPGFCIRRRDGLGYDFYVLPPMTGRDGKPFGEDLQDSMDDCNDILSEWIKKYPDQWMWMYPRWESVEQGDFDDVLGH